MSKKTKDLKHFYKQWYTQKVEAKLTIGQKLDLLKRISELNRNRSLRADQDKNYIKQFPELEPYSNTGKISGLQLFSIKEAILEELHFPA